MKNRALSNSDTVPSLKSRSHLPGDTINKKKMLTKANLTNAHINPLKLNKDGSQQVRYIMQHCLC